jgi:hypothetical protein
MDVAWHRKNVIGSAPGKLVGLCLFLLHFLTFVVLMRCEFRRTGARVGRSTFVVVFLAARSLSAGARVQTRHRRRRRRRRRQSYGRLRRITICNNSKLS